jgi:RNA 3'-terminal phosphate cyclase (ATP)
MYIIDGSYGEGGGQILRYAAALSAALQKPVKVINIRAKRPNPGLRPQHLGGIKILQKICGGSVEGLKVGSREVIMDFGEAKSGHYEYNVGTAGSITLIIQSLMPMLSLSNKDISISIIGGTDVKWSPTSDYMKNVFLNNLRTIGISAEMDIIRRGYYPKGGGKVILKVYSESKLKPITIYREEIIFTEVISIASNLPKHVAMRQVKPFRHFLEKHVPGEKSFKISTLGRDEAIGPGTSIVIYSKMSNGIYAGGDGVGERGKPAESVGWDAYQRFLDWFNSSASLDINMGDMIIPFLFLSDGNSRFSVPRLSKHIESALYVATNLTEREYKIDEKDGVIWINVL